MIPTIVPAVFPVPLIAPVAIVSTAALLAPAAVVIAFFHPLVGPMTWFVAIGSVLATILGPDPPGATLARLFPASRSPGPAIILAIPIASDPHMIPAGAIGSDLYPNRGWCIRSDANMNGAEIHT